VCDDRNKASLHFHQTKRELKNFYVVGGWLFYVYLALYFSLPHLFVQRRIDNPIFKRKHKKERTVNPRYMMTTMMMAGIEERKVCVRVCEEQEKGYPQERRSKEYKMSGEKNSLDSGLIPFKSSHICSPRAHIGGV
jgi:hypothetical protein